MLESEARLEETLSLVRGRGFRITTARRAVLQALVLGGSHMTAEDLAAMVQKSHPDIHLSTIYRTLESMEEIDIVDHVHLGHGRAVYHLTTDTHQHLVCEVCGSVIETPSRTFEQLAIDLRSAYGFELRTHHFAVLGRCKICSTGARPPANL